jgi:hypothetical protein
LEDRPGSRQPRSDTGIWPRQIFILCPAEQLRAKPACEQVKTKQAGLIAQHGAEKKGPKNRVTLKQVIIHTTQMLLLGTAIAFQAMYTG